MFVDFLFSDSMQVYEEVIDFNQLRNHLNAKLEDYNRQPKSSKMNIVLFRDAITHVTRIYRIINLKRGHCMLVGVGGSGRHSLTRLSSYISTMTCE